MNLPTGNILKVVALFERRKHGRLIVSRKKLYYFDNLSLPILSDGKTWHCLTMTAEEREPFMMEVRKSLKPIPKKVLH